MSNLVNSDNTTCVIKDIYIMNEYDQFRSLLSRKKRPKSAKTEQNDKILKNVVGGPTQLLEGGRTGRQLLDWRVVDVVGFEGSTECKYRPCRV